ncbi:hypothetical protein GCM10009745_35910 [Kribbella yunnanensis]|uniref:Uncharacterized protein n=1 Tax=Kribbella yunnanensis TaxID=190194 RepID=A0ABP4TGX9_9ACTN
MIALHMGGIPETAMVLGPILLIIAFLRIARRNEASPGEEDDWDADLGDLPASASGGHDLGDLPIDGLAISSEPGRTRSADPPERRSASTAAAETRAGTRDRSH